MTPTGVYPAFRENTAKSFQQAAKCGVSFVEFDVQVTSDGVPVIWHDDKVRAGDASSGQGRPLSARAGQAQCHALVAFKHCLQPGPCMGTD